MTESTIEPHIIKKTQESLGKFVKKPTLSEKLLKKPPFRFLHDVIAVIIRDTGAFNELYSHEELNVENIKDRDAKISFLQKIIDVVKISTKINLTVRASKIVAGHEPEKTNELLQCIGVILEKQIDCKDAIEIVKNGGIPKEKSKNKEKEDKVDKKTKPKSDNASKKSTEPKEKQKVGTKEKVTEKSTRKIVKVSSVESDKAKREEKSKSNRNTQVKRESSKDSTPDKNKKSEDKIRKSIKSENNKKSEEIRRNSSTKNENLNGVIEKSEARQVLNEEKNSIINAPTTPPSLLDNNNFESKGESNTTKEKILINYVGDNNNQSPTRNKAENERKTSGTKKSAESKVRKSSADTNRSQRDEQNLSSGEFKSLDISAQKPLEKIHEIENIITKSNSNIELSENLNGQSEVQRQSTFVREETNISMTGRPRTSLRPPSARPASARPGAPRRRDKNVEIILQPNDQIKLGSVNVKLETFNAELEDDGETLVIIENSNNIDDSSSVETNTQNKNIEDNLNNQGHLVQQILETQKELVQSNEQQIGQKAEKEFDSNLIQNRQNSARQVDTLKDVIQILTKSINPLGKLMDFIPEDIDSMQLELTMWRDNYTQAASELRKEKSLTEYATEPMKIQLTQIEASIKEYEEMIDTVRSKIIQNSEKIHRLLSEQ